MCLRCFAVVEQRLLRSSHSIFHCFDCTEQWNYHTVSYSLRVCIMNTEEYITDLDFSFGLLGSTLYGVIPGFRIRALSIYNDFCFMFSFLNKGISVSFQYCLKILNHFPAHFQTLPPHIFLSSSGNVTYSR